jgi:hypothetical protein
MAAAWFRLPYRAIPGVCKIAQITLLRYTGPAEAGIQALEQVPGSESGR